MEKKEVLKICAENGFFLDKYMLDFFVGLDRKDVLDVIGRLKIFGFDGKILTKVIFDKYDIRVGFEDRGLDIKVLKNIDFDSGKLEARDFVDYFRFRFDVLKDILIGEGGFENLSSIRRVGFNSGVFDIVGMVYDKRITKNKNLLIEVEDLTGRTILLVNRENKQLFKQASELLLDDVCLFKCSGSSKMLFVNEIVWPDCRLDRESFGKEDGFVAFVGDLHVGSVNFLEKNFVKFIDWLNGGVGDFRQKEIAAKVKYLVLIGDNIEGVGVYPGQEKFLKIKGCRDQYEKLFEILAKVRKDVEIIICPGTHDAVWVGEPQPKISEKWAWGLKSMHNLKMVSNPSFFEVSGLKFFVYHGASLNRFIDEIERIRVGVGHGRPTLVINEILKRRHLAPIYGKMDIVPGKQKDDLVLDEVFDVFVVGGQHRAEVGTYNNILTISTSSFQSKTDFEERVGVEPDFARVPILNLKTKEIKILDFGGNDGVG